MKSTIHPQWYPAAKVSCACGNTFTVGATTDTIKVEICSNCHPFYTGEMKFVDTMGRVERFQKKQQVGQQMSSVLSDKKKKKKEREEAAARAPKSLKEMLMGLQ
ncbi:50S ribosomal protein L31 [Candidatus Gottesmanbacteria bacterium]|nr:50S ribosomal protein L31 [Candidatus Gottesmanbacteria bacterium]